MLTHAAFIEAIEAFLKRHKMSETRFGREALSDPSFVSDLREGRMPGLRVIGRVDNYMREQDGLAEVEAAK